jgi:hypothetical protein
MVVTPAEVLAAAADKLDVRSAPGTHRHAEDRALAQALRRDAARRARNAGLGLQELLDLARLIIGEQTNENGDNA